jgi:hypothetical protein
MEVDDRDKMNLIERSGGLPAKWRRTIGGDPRGFFGVLGLPT